MTDLINTIIITRTKLAIQLMRQGDDLETAITNTEQAVNTMVQQTIELLQTKQENQEGWKA